VSTTVPSYRWSTSEFLRAWEAGAFDHRVELVEGEIWPVVIGDWHGDTVFRLARMLGNLGLVGTTATLPSGTSLPDPDCWVRREGAEPSGTVGSRLSTWRPADVLLVVEVSDEALMADLTTKARIYGSAGWPVYWVVSPEAVYVHSEPHAQGYRLRQEYRAGDQLPVGYADVLLPVDQLLSPTA
jgi:Uma2 family endonuclease